MPRSKKAVFLCLATVAVLAAASLAYALIIRGPLLGGPMVQLPRTDSFVIVWEMREDRRTSARIQRREGEWSEPQKTACEGGRCEATFTGLNPGTFYAYEIRYAPVDPNVEPLAEGLTRTDPGRGGPFRFLAFGDSGSGYDQQYELGKLMAGYDADVAVHTGDVVYPNGKASHYSRKFYRPYEELLARTVFFPSLGNHDWDDYRGGPYFDQFTLPKNGPKDTIPERHYWFDFGDVRFISLDTDASFRSMRTHIAPWLERVLADAGDRWKIAYFHHAVYTNGDHAPRGKVLQVIMPILERWRAHVVLVGHNHMYERSRPVLDGRVVSPEVGIVHVTTGAGGAKLQTIEKPKPDYLVLQNDSMCSFTVVDVTPEQLAFRQIGLDGAVMDEFVVGHRIRTLPTTQTDAVSMAR